MTHNELKEIIRARAGWLYETDVLRLRNIVVNNKPAIRVKCTSCGRAKELINRIYSKNVCVHGAIMKYKESGNLFTVAESDIS